MTTLASRAQLRASFIRWALFIVPAIVLLGFLAGQLAGTGEGDPWFAALAKPDFYPDAQLFPIVWGILYVMMGLAFALVCSAWGAKGRGIAIVAFIVQFALNLAWTPLFFGQHEITYALYLIAALNVGRDRGWSPLVVVFASVAVLWAGAAMLRGAVRKARAERLALEFESDEVLDAGDGA